jgi:hypothetical protein
VVLALSLISHTVVVTVQYERGSEREDLLTRCFFLMLARTVRYGMERRLLALCFYIRTVALLYDTWGRGKAFAQMTLHGLEIVTVAFKSLEHL